MQQIVITKYGKPKVLKIQEKENPRPAGDELVIQVSASGINFADILARKGLYPDAPKPPCVVGYEVAGIVESAGNDAHSNKIGKRVLAFTRFGGYSSKVNIPADAVYEIPKSLSFEQAVAVPVSYLTAYQLLVVMGGLKKGESVLIHNAGGGVGLAALDIARHIGAVTFGTAGPGKHDFLRERGLIHVIDYHTQDFLSTVLEITEGKGVELVIDPLGGKHWKNSYKALRAAGRLGMFGVSTVSGSGGGKILPFLRLLWRMPWYNPIMLMNANKSVFGVNMLHMFHEVDKIRGWMKHILKGVEDGWVRPHVDKVFSFAEAGEAHAYIEARKNIGKVVLMPEE